MRRRRKTLGEPTKQDFVAIAQILCRNRVGQRVVEDMSDYFAAKNPRFARGRFEEAAACWRK